VKLHRHLADDIRQGWSVGYDLTPQIWLLTLLFASGGLRRLHA
jgi:hypothetical protein